MKFGEVVGVVRVGWLVNTTTMTIYYDYDYDYLLNPPSILSVDFVFFSFILFSSYHPISSTPSSSPSPHQSEMNNVQKAKKKQRKKK